MNKVFINIVAIVALFFIGMMWGCSPTVNTDSIEFEEVTITQKDGRGTITKTIKLGQDEQNMLRSWLRDFSGNAFENNEPQEAPLTIQGDCFSISFTDGGSDYFSSNCAIMNVWGKASSANWLQLKRELSPADQHIKNWLLSKF